MSEDCQFILFGSGLGPGTCEVKFVVPFLNKAFVMSHFNLTLPDSWYEKANIKQITQIVLFPIRSFFWGSSLEIFCVLLFFLVVQPEFWQVKSNACSYHTLPLW